MKSDRMNEPVDDKCARVAWEIALYSAEMNTILARIRRRRTGEPTTAEKTRLLELRDDIARLKQGGYL